MEQQEFNRLHAMLTTHVNFKEVHYLTHKNRYYFERIGEAATIQIPTNKLAKFIYTYSEEEKRDMPFWLQHIVQQCEVHFQEPKVKEEEPKTLTMDHKELEEEEEDWVDLPILLKGTLETEEQRSLVRQLIRTGFEVFPDQD